MAFVNLPARHWLWFRLDWSFLFRKKQTGNIYLSVLQLDGRLGDVQGHIDWKDKNITMTSIPQNWSATAFNQVPNSSNKIHSDEIAKAYGFQGGLVPGVTLSAYLVHPAILAWGERWLERGYAHVKVESPVYDGNSFFVDVTAKPNTYSAELVSAGKRCAIGEVSLPEMTPPARSNWKRALVL